MYSSLSVPQSKCIGYVSFVPSSHHFICLALPTLCPRLFWVNTAPLLLNFLLLRACCPSSLSSFVKCYTSVSFRAHIPIYSPFHPPKFPPHKLTTFCFHETKNVDEQFRIHHHHRESYEGQHSPIVVEACTLYVD